MIAKTKIALIIPCYNEQESIGKLLAHINEFSKTLPHFAITPIVVNDCSTDHTYLEAAKYSCVILDLPVNLGIGGAVQTGYLYALKNNFDIAIQIDGDGQHPISAIPSLVDPIINDECDISIGSRFITKEGFQSTAMRRVGIQFFKWLNALLVGVTVYDSTSGLRAVNRKVLEVLSKFYPDDFPEPVAVSIYAHFKFRIKEIPVVMLERQGGTSSITAAKSVYYMIKVSMSIFFVLLKLRKWKT
jgi:glycosyltransferase involved in cell wall biosynthesis